MEPISPTRTELLARRAQIQLARQGADLLRGKREALVREFLSELERFVSTREALLEALTRAKQSLMLAMAMDGPQAVASAGLGCRRPIELSIQERNIWGTRVAEVTANYGPRSASGKGFDTAGSSLRIAEAADRFESAMDLILRVAPLDRKLSRLAEEIRRTSRRVNALEQRLLPTLNEQVLYIRGVLDQREREDVFRLKHLKKRRA